MRLWVAGASGMLGQEVLAEANRRGATVVGTVRETLDLAEIREVRHFAAHFGPFDHVVNCVAYTAVDRAESEREAAEIGNVVIPGVLAEAGLSVIHISTDYAYSRGYTEPIPEGAEANPVGVYAETKVAGDLAVLASGGTVVRTAWLFGPGGPNFLRTMARLFAEREEARVVNDQWGNPTYTPHLAVGLLDLLSTGVEPGIRHLVGPEPMTWYSLAQRWFEVLRAKGIPMLCQRVTPITTAEYPTAAPRPAYSVLHQTLPPLPSLADALDAYAGHLMSQS